MNRDTLIRLGVFIGLILLLNVLSYAFHWNVRIY